jgi:hypothetical protein
VVQVAEAGTAAAVVVVATGAVETTAAADIEAAGIVVAEVVITAIEIVIDTTLAISIPAIRGDFFAFQQVASYKLRNIKTVDGSIRDGATLVYSLCHRYLNNGFLFFSDRFIVGSFSPN